MLTLLAAWLSLALAPTPRACPGQELTVLDATGAPVAGAEVRVATWEELTALAIGLNDDEFDSADDLWRRCELVGVSDAQGIVALGESRPGGLALAWTDQLFGSAPLMESAPITVRVAPAPTIEVQVVDAQGVGVPGVQVGIQAWHGEQPLGAAPAGRTDALGRVDVRHFTPFLALGDPDAWAITLPTVVSRAPIEARYDPSSPTGRAVRLTLPKVGPLRLRLLSAGGGPLELDGALMLSVADAPESTPAMFRTRASERLVPHVELGQELDVQVVSLAAPLGKQRVAGPTRADVEGIAEVTVRQEGEKPGEDEVLLRARLLAPDGQPLASQPVNLDVGNQDHSAGFNGSRTEEDGSIQWRVSVREWARDSQVHASLSHHRPDGRAYSMEIALDALRPGHTLDLGDRRMSVAALVLAGHVLDRSGRPVANAEVQLGSTDGLLEGPDESRQAGGLDVRTDARGHFEIRGLDRDGLNWRGPLKVRARHATLGVTPWTPFERRAPSVELRLEEPAVLEGRLVLDEGILSTWLRLELTAHGATTLGPSSGIAPRADGSFTLDQAPPGVADLHVWNAGPGSIHEFVKGTPVRVIESIHIGSQHDPRLNPIDLRGALHLYTLTILGPDGEPSAMPRCSLRNPMGWISTWDSFGRKPHEHRILSEAHPLEVRVDASGMRARILELNAPSHALRLEPGIPVQVEVANLPSVPPHVRLHADLCLVGIQGTPSIEVELDERGLGDAALPEPGTYRFLSIQPHGHAAMGKMTGSWAGQPVHTDWERGPTFEVLDTDGPQLLRMDLSVEQARALRRSAERVAGSSE